MRPLAVYIYSFGSQSCTARLGLNRSAPLRRRNKPRMAPCSCSAARPSSFIGLVVPQPLAAAWPPASCIRHLRRDTSSAGYRHPCLACICRCSSRTGRAALAPAVRLPLEAACTSEAVRFSSFLLRVVGLSRLRLAAVKHCENPLRKFLSRFIIPLSKIKTPKGWGGSRLGYPWLLRLTPVTTCPLAYRVQKGDLVQRLSLARPSRHRFRPMFIGL